MSSEILETEGNSYLRRYQELRAVDNDHLLCRAQSCKASSVDK